MTAPTTITESELQAEYTKLDALRLKIYQPLLTDQQFQLISYAREHDNPVSWRALTHYWEACGWGHIGLSTLKSRYSKDKRRREAHRIRHQIL